ncbi:response regulator, receiver domain protein [Brucella vulpis]|nr:response regulator, receiver domain protein [Brucella vulpis]CUW49415.1 response regulator, receiver domain protein [Brucella vulpis]
MNDLEHRRILVVEDEVFVALDVAATVEDANGTVVGPVGTVRQAIDLINRQEVDAAILDVNLADGDVEPGLDRLKSRNIFVVIHTAAVCRHALQPAIPKCRFSRSRYRHPC